MTPREQQAYDAASAAARHRRQCDQAHVTARHECRPQAEVADAHAAYMQSMRDAQAAWREWELVRFEAR